MPPPPPLPTPPVLERLFLENPLPLVMILAAVALMTTWALHRAGRTGAGLLSGGMLGVLIAGILLVAAWVTTDREALSQSTLRLVEVTAATDLTRLERLLASDARLLSPARNHGLPVPGAGLDKAGILRRVSETLGGAYAVRSARVLDLQAQVLGPSLGRTQFRVRVLPRDSSAPHHSWWLLEWRRESDGAWRVLTITPLWVEGLDPRNG